MDKDTTNVLLWKKSNLFSSAQRKWKTNVPIPKTHLPSIAKFLYKTVL
jgi:hypothetical protein